MSEEIKQLEKSIEKVINKENVIYFLTYDTKGTPRAAIKNIYDMALALRLGGYNAKILVEDDKYSGVEVWLDSDKSYDDIPVVNIKTGAIEINVEDVIVVPEYYSHVLQQLSNIRAVKIMLIQQKDYIFETLSVGSRWSDFGFDKCITTNEKTKKYILEYFPETLVFLLPPYIGDEFRETETPKKPFIAISCRDRVESRKIISEFYLKYPQLRWVTFRDMINMSYTEFADALSECMVSVWVDDESTFGTFPLESMKCGVPVIGKIPDQEPEWLGENGMWTYDGNKIAEILGTYVLSWLEGIELSDEVKDKMKEAYLTYNKLSHAQSTISIFDSLIKIRLDSLTNALDKFSHKEDKEENKND